VVDALALALCPGFSLAATAGGEIRAHRVEREPGFCKLKLGAGWRGELYATRSPEVRPACEAPVRIPRYLGASVQKLCAATVARLPDLRASAYRSG